MNGNTRAAQHEANAQRFSGKRRVRAATIFGFSLAFALFCAFNFAVLYYLFPVYIAMSLFYLTVRIVRGLRSYSRAKRTASDILDDLAKGKLSPEQAESELKRCRPTS